MKIENIQIYNEDGTATGQTVPRNEIHSKGLWHKTVHVWLVNQKNEVLLQKRSMTKDSFPGKWDISSAGHVEQDATPLDAAIREVSEELGISVRPDELQFLFSLRRQSIHRNGAFVDNEFTDVYLLRKDIAIENLAIDTREVVDAAFIPLAIFRDWVHDKIVELVPHVEEYERLLKELQENTIGH